MKTSDTPRTDEWEKASSPYAELLELARCLEREVAELKAAKGYVQDYRATGPNGETVAAICATDGCAMLRPEAQHAAAAGVTEEKKNV
jgi:hypothetical protein